MQNATKQLIEEVVVCAVIFAMLAPVPAFMVTLLVFPLLHNHVDSNTLVLIVWVLCWPVMMAVQFRRHLRRWWAGRAAGIDKKLSSRDMSR